MTDGARFRLPAMVALVIGLGLVVAPAAFGMFTRAPGGGEMLDDFRPFMSSETIGSFQGHMATLGAAAAEAPVTADLPATGAFVRQWSEIDADMGDMLVSMGENTSNYAAVDALPPFALFPFFFLLPGLFLAGFAFWFIRSGRRHALIGVVAVALGLIAAPFMFQMFDRAPKGGEMIDAFKPLMTREKVVTVQGYFVVLGAGEGELRTQVIAASDPNELPAVRQLAKDWPCISNEMAPMIGAMNDNLDNFSGVAAMPPFPLFPWFFVAPGVIVLGFVGLARFRRSVPGIAPATAVVVVIALLAGACASSGYDGSGREASGLSGLLAVAAGECAEAGVSAGSWFRMAQPGGDAASGPFVANGDSTCGDNTWTPMTPGSDAGLRLGEFQPQAEPPFDDGGNALSGAIVAPVKFFAVDFGLATNETDPQTGSATVAPAIANDGGALSGDLSAVAASWNGQHFNQGSPKPGGESGGATPALTGTYDDATGAYSLDWTSLIKGGPFDGFTGVWHLEGVLRE
ncbi:MAG: hypothetical protein ACR2H3_05135 [Acidimicrobiales bacterium]